MLKSQHASYRCRSFVVCRLECGSTPKWYSSYTTLSLCSKLVPLHSLRSFRLTCQPCPLDRQQPHPKFQLNFCVGCGCSGKLRFPTPQENCYRNYLVPTLPMHPPETSSDVCKGSNRPLRTMQLRSIVLPPAAENLSPQSFYWRDFLC